MEQKILRRLIYNDKTEALLDYELRRPGEIFDINDITSAGQGLLGGYCVF